MHTVSNSAKPIEVRGDRADDKRRSGGADCSAHNAGFGGNCMQAGVIMRGGKKRGQLKVRLYA